MNVLWSYGISDLLIHHPTFAELKEATLELLQKLIPDHARKQQSIAMASTYKMVLE